MDPQASLTQAFGREDRTDRLYNAFVSRAGLPVDRLSDALTLSPTSIELSRAETELIAEPGREHFLRTGLEKTRLPEGTVVLLDCPPSLGILSVNRLSTAGGLVAAVQPGGFELHALVHLQMAINTICERVHPDLGVLGYRAVMLTQAASGPFRQLTLQGPEDPRANQSPGCYLPTLGWVSPAPHASR